MQRLLSDLLSNANSKLSRQSVEATVLALLSLFAVSALRYGVESRTLFIAEMLSIAFCFACALFASSKTPIISATVPMVPLVAAFIARFTGSPIAYEMTMLTMLGAAALGMAIGSARTRATSLIASGFLTLFAVAISDSQYAVLIAIAWMAGCVWHLVANHWERLDLCAVENVQRSHGVRPASVLAAVVLFGISGWIVRDRFSDSTQLTFGFMPTSGGSKWSDPAARSGVGTGDAAIAAKDHAESFGAVESDLFLESTESTLFDMFSDSIGEPKRKMKWERRQGLTAERVLEAHQKTAKSEKGGNSFSIDRMPAEKHLKLKDAVENAVIQWAGPTGIRLAMNRYDTFDGVEWSNSASHRNENLVRQANEDAVWFCDPSLVIRKTGDPQPKTVVNQLKVLRLDSTRLPTPMITAGVHIKDVDRQDFFAIDDDGSYFMPGREKVPQMTVVNMASQTVLEDVLWEQVSTTDSNEEQETELANLVEAWTADCEHPLEKLHAIVDRLRSEFTFDRTFAADSDTPVSEFLKTKRGGDHLFATTATLMAREIGLSSRLVTGFYVRPTAIDVGAGHSNVLPEDVHVWPEIQLADGRWFEIEPTPTFREPIYHPSMWLVTKRFAAAYWIHGLVLLAVLAVLYVTRLTWIDLGLGVLYPVGSMVWPRGRMSLAMRILQTRAKLAGCPRRPGLPQRDWLLSLTSTHASLRDSAARFCDAADRAAFSSLPGALHQPSLSNELLMNLNIKTIRRLASEPRS